LRERTTVVQYPLEQQLNAATRVLLTEQACRNDTGVVEYQQVAAREQRR